MSLVIHRTVERPGIELWLLDEDGDLIDFSTGYTFELKIGSVGAEAVLTKTSGITGEAGSGAEPSGTPNVAVAFSAGDLDDLAAGAYTLQLRATASGVDRLYQYPVEVRDIIS